jgi:hypothetical protein
MNSSMWEVKNRVLIGRAGTRGRQAWQLPRAQWGWGRSD